MHKTSFKINKNSEPFIIAEAGINHNGNIGKALEMIHVAKNAGADAIKFQAFKASGIVADGHQACIFVESHCARLSTRFVADEFG